MQMWEAGFYVRWGGDTLQFGPPFVAEQRDVAAVFEQVERVLSRMD